MGGGGVEYGWHLFHQEGMERVEADVRDGWRTQACQGGDEADVRSCGSFKACFEVRGEKSAFCLFPAFIRTWSKFLLRNRFLYKRRGKPVLLYWCQFRLFNGRSVVAFCEIKVANCVF